MHLHLLKKYFYIVVLLAYLFNGCRLHISPFFPQLFPATFVSEVRVDFLFLTSLSLLAMFLSRFLCTLFYEIYFFLIF